MKANKQDSDEKIVQFTETLKAEMKANKQDSDEKMMKFIETLKFLTAFMMDQNNI